MCVEWRLDCLIVFHRLSCTVAQIPETKLYDRKAAVESSLHRAVCAGLCRCRWVRLSMRTPVRNVYAGIRNEDRMRQWGSLNPGINLNVNLTCTISNSIGLFQQGNVPWHTNYSGMLWERLQRLHGVDLVFRFPQLSIQLSICVMSRANRGKQWIGVYSIHFYL